MNFKNKEYWVGYADGIKEGHRLALLGFSLALNKSDKVDRRITGEKKHLNTISRHDSSSHNSRYPPHKSTNRDVEDLFDYDGV